MILHIGKLPRGWSRDIPGHSVQIFANGKRVKYYRSPEYLSWLSMIQRCYCKYQKTYKGNATYQAAGVLVCSRWVLSFHEFLLDMGERPDGCTLDRIDPSGNYEPSNCRWADRKTQALNKKRKTAA